MAQPKYDNSFNVSPSIYTENQQLPPPTERQPIVRSRANITSACLACKRRKRKCLGGSPCPHCASLRIQCSYDERLDKRRKAFNDKARAEIDFQRRLLDGLIRAIKSEHAPSVLEMVRQDASLEEIAAQLDHMGMLTATQADTPEYASSRAKSYDSEGTAAGGLTSIPQSSTQMTTILTAESETSHALSINQLLAPQSQSNQDQRQSAMSPSISIPSLSEVLIQAQKHRLQDEEEATTALVNPTALSSFPPPLPLQQDQLNGPRLFTFPARIEVKPLVSSSGAGQPSLTSHPPQDRTSGLSHPHSHTRSHSHSHSPILDDNPRHAISPS